MYATVTTYQAKPGQQQNLVKTWQDAAGVAMKQQSGFKEASLLPEMGSDCVLLISMWETEQDFQAWQKTDAREQARATVAELCAESPKTSICDVAFHANV